MVHTWAIVGQISFFSYIGLYKYIYKLLPIMYYQGKQKSREAKYEKKKNWCYSLYAHGW